MAGRLEGRAAVITGAASGIGAETATRLAHEGAAIVVADINLPGAEHLVARIIATGAAAAAVRVDLGDEQSITDMIAFAVGRFGGLDILDNNAADTRLSATRDVGVEHTDTQVWDTIMRINLRGTMLACRAAITGVSRCRSIGVSS